MAAGAMDRPQFSPNQAPALDGLPPLPPSPTNSEPMSSSSPSSSRCQTRQPSSSPQPPALHPDSRPDQPLQSPGAQPVERLAHRLSKQTLLPLGRPVSLPSQPQDTCVPLSLPVFNPQIQTPEGFNFGFLQSQAPMAMEVDSNEERNSPSTTAITATPQGQLPPSMRSLKRPIEEISSDDNLPRWWDIDAIQRRRCRARGPSNTIISRTPSSDTLPVLPPIDIDSIFGDMPGMLEVDEEECAASAARGVDITTGDDLMTTYKIEYRTSRQAAKQCSRLVRNRPRLRKRKRKSEAEESRMRARTMDSVANKHYRAAHAGPDSAVAESSLFQGHASIALPPA